MVTYLVYQSSQTQKVIAQRNDDGSWLVSKYWRRTANDEWVKGKGIEFPIVNGAQTSKRLGEILVTDGNVGSVESEPKNTNKN